MANETPNETQGTAVLGIRMEEDLREKIREASRLEGRTESNFARFYLGKAADVVISKNTSEELPA